MNTRQARPLQGIALLLAALASSTFKAVRSIAPFTGANAYKTKRYAKWYAANVAKTKYKWNAKQFKCLNNLWQKESRWNFQSRSTKHKFLGIPQMYRGNLKNMNINLDYYMATPELQIQIGAKYIKGKYGDQELAVVSPDAGRIKVAERWSARLGGAPLAFIHKTRDPRVPNQVVSNRVVGDVERDHVRGAAGQGRAARGARPGAGRVAQQQRCGGPDQACRWTVPDPRGSG